MPTRNKRTGMDDQKKDDIDPEGPPHRNHSKQLQTHNFPTDEVENINSTNKRRDLLLAKKPQIVARGTERMPQRIQMTRRVTLHRSAHRQREQDQTTKRHMICPTKLDNEQPQNAQNIK